VSHVSTDRTDLIDAIWSAASIELGKAIRAALSGADSALSRAARFSDGLAVQALLDAARQSHAERKWVQL
jgi:predicted dehydrogenase